MLNSYSIKNVFQIAIIFVKKCSWGSFCLFIKWFFFEIFENFP